MTESTVVDRVHILYSELNESDQSFAIETASNAIRAQDKSEHSMYNKDLAQTIKKEFDAQKGGTWNVIVGKSFGAFVTHETKTMSYFFLGNLGFMLWRHG